ncbi:MATE family efflux transporter [Shewanella sp. NIFS-20-20]|uniref:MATE family efflux transporter n=1 Tax=Shewanella sp. NIFS-20-20 TaxID=2853806 RepID=UPI001C47999B|nr:MATE family efflux transporter [Shewanella sp. NIFS-20-20]MBV7315335.1 MATE family efflux transporter [Shewanella sp. NIFS-20-20]
MNQPHVVAPDPLLNESITRLFWRYSIPTIMSMLVTGIYVTIDGIFIGHYLGEQGLAALMLAYPVGAVLYALGAMIGMGSAALVSINLGQGNQEKARHFVGNALSLSLITGLVMAILGSVFSRDILLMLGAEGEILEGAYQYLIWYFLLGIFPVLSLTFTSLLRNDGRPGFVTWVLIAGGVMNIGLDWLLIVVYPMGLAGAAIATMLSQAFTGLLCLQHFFSAKTKLRIHWQQLKLSVDNCLNIARVGFPSMLMNLYLSVVLTLHNMAFLWVGGPIFVAAYGVVSYTEAIFYLIFEGIAFGTQPILSYNAGAGRYDRVKQARRLAFVVTLITAFIGLLMIYGYPQGLVYLFAGDNEALTPVAVEGMRLYFWGLPMEGMLLVGASFFQAINCSREASILTASKLLLIALLLIVLAWWLGSTGVWLALPICSCVLALWMGFAMRRQDRLHA